MRTIIHWMFNVLLIFIIFFGVVILLGPRFSNIELLTVLSPSMSPTIPMGSIVVIEPANVPEIRVGEVITYGSMEFPGSTVTHRVIEVLNQESNPAFRTQGDANDAPDLDPVPSSLVLGRVIFHLPLIGFIIQFIRKPVGFLLVILIPAVMVLVGEVQELLNLKKKAKRTIHANEKTTSR